MNDTEMTLYKYCQQAFSQAIAENAGKRFPFSDAVAMNRALEIVKELTSAKEWSLEFLFEDVCKHYLAICGNQIGYRAGKRKDGVYFSKETHSELLNKGLIMNANGDVRAHEEVASELNENYAEKFSINGYDGQIAFDDDAVLYTERSIAALSKMVKEA